jgi:SAM-dependent methyltransferase
MKNTIGSLLSHPLTRGLDLDDPNTTRLRKQIIREKGFLRRIYQVWYQDLADQLPEGEGRVLEIGSGAGFLEETLPEVITSDVFFCPWLSMIADARRLPFARESLRAIVMNNVFHHIPDVEAFLREAARCIRVEGRLVMIEPWVSTWSRFVYKRLHHEPFDPQTKSWRLEASGPLSSANSALPWIIFSRDRYEFQDIFPEWRILRIKYDMPFCYLLSGGVSLRSLMPEFAFSAWRRLEKLLAPWMERWAMFAMIVLEKRL